MTGSSQYSYPGVGDSGDGSHSFNANTFFVQRLLNQRHTATVAQVVNTTNIVSPGSAEPIKTIDVLPLVNQLDGNGNPIPHEIVYGVPYLRSQGGQNAVIVDPSPGDIGIFLIAETDISSVKATGKQSNPGSGRRGNFSDGMYIGSIHAAAPQRYISFVDGEGVKIVVKSGETVAITGIVTATGNITAGFGGSDSVTLQGHIHPDPQGGNTGIPVAGT